MLCVSGLQARSSASAAAVSLFVRTSAYVGLRLFLPAMVVLLATGIWMVLISSEWHFSQFWVLLAIVLFAVAFLIGAVYLSRIAIQLGRSAEGGEATSPKSGTLLTQWIAGYGVVLIVLLVAVWDMVFKPGT